MAFYLRYDSIITKFDVFSTATSMLELKQNTSPKTSVKSGEMLR
jgi:hypothetical protein